MTCWEVWGAVQNYFLFWRLEVGARTPAPSRVKKKGGKQYRGVSGVESQGRSLVADYENLDIPWGVFSTRSLVYMDHSIILLSLN